MATQVPSAVLKFIKIIFLALFQIKKIKCVQNHTESICYENIALKTIVVRIKFIHAYILNIIYKTIWFFGIIFVLDRSMYILKIFPLKKKRCSLWKKFYSVFLFYEKHCMLCKYLTFPSIFIIENHFQLVGSCCLFRCFLKNCSCIRWFFRTSIDHLRTFWSSTLHYKQLQSNHALQKIEILLFKNICI